MDTLGPRIMVNVGTQAVTNTGLNPRDLAPLTNDAFLATFMGKPALSANNGISRQHNNNRQSYTTQMERVTLRSKGRPSTTNGESIEPDSAILSIIRGNGLENNQQQTSQRQLQGNRNRRGFHQQQYYAGWNDIPCSPNYRPANDSNRQRRTRSGGAQQQITVVDQMAAQPHIPYAILPKRFEPKQVSTNDFQQRSRSSNNNASQRRRPAAPAAAAAPPRRPQRQQTYFDDQWEDVEDDQRRLFNQRPNRNFGQTNTYRGPRQHFNNYYDSYSYGPMSRQDQMPVRPRRRMMYQDDGYVPFDITPSYDLNEWQGPYARSRQALYSQQQRGGFRYGNGFIRDDHRINNSTKQSRNNNNKGTTPTQHRKQTKSPKNKGSQKRRTSRPRKQRNQNSKSDGIASTNTNEVKSTNETETTQEEKPKEETTIETGEEPLPPRDTDKKEPEVEKSTE
ncbi:unnamed protein product [Rotaria magnacalcarata]|uniref:Uncharacterized protein n=1 Tax=Rotaria magnacalcarata TaxID=392030 RepID=A0A816MTX1_9BILA|nr:unnamed protein product [Rotaria magnacalcarata]CAF2103698.1 unnamed protein product [Rotaria magnacalcarata]CAF3746239.1 unnamed protein product [Rotaria magnacalcarata]CAF4045997.1 unnamed protein product [Rotaria magnacalcarata]